MTGRWRVTRVLLGTESAADWTIGSLGQCWKCWKHGDFCFLQFCRHWDWQLCIQWTIRPFSRWGKHGDFCFHQFCRHWDWQLCIQWTIRPFGTGNMLTPVFTKSAIIWSDWTIEEKRLLLLLRKSSDNCFYWVNLHQVIRPSFWHRIIRPIMMETRWCLNSNIIEI